MKKLLPVFLGMFLLLSSLGAGAGISFYRREAMVDRKSATFTDTILFRKAPEKLSLPFFFSVKEFSSRSTLSSHECDVQEKEFGSLVECELPGGEEGRLTLQFKTVDVIEKMESHYYFKDSLDVPLQTNRLAYTVRLEKGLVLVSQNSSSPFPQYSPKSGEKGSDGRRIFVYWTKEDLTEGDGISPSISFEGVREPKEDYSSLYTLIAGAVILVILLVLSLKLGKEEKELALKEDEKKVMDIIESSSGGIKQKRIVENVPFSKAKVSRLIKDLQERGLVEKEKVGRTNRIRLDEGEENE